MSGALRLTKNSIKGILFLWYKYKWDKTFLKFEDVKIEKKMFHCFQSPIHIDNVNIDKMVRSEANPCAKAVLSILSATKIMKIIQCWESCSEQWVGFLKIYDGTESLSLFVEDEKLLKR